MSNDYSDNCASTPTALEQTCLNISDKFETNFIIIAPEKSNTDIIYCYPYTLKEYTTANGETKYNFEMESKGAGIYNIHTQFFVEITELPFEKESIKQIMDKTTQTKTLTSEDSELKSILIVNDEFTNELEQFYKKVYEEFNPICPIVSEGWDAYQEHIAKHNITAPNNAEVEQIERAIIQNRMERSLNPFKPNVPAS